MNRREFNLGIAAIVAAITASDSMEAEACPKQAAPQSASADTFISQRVLYTEAEEGGYVITFPDIPEAITQSDSMDDCLFQAADALATAIIERLIHGVAVPVVSVSDFEPPIANVKQSIIGIYLRYDNGEWMDVTLEHWRPFYPNDSQLMRHAIDTFGSEEAAREWLSIECGALNNQAPLDYIARTGNEAEVERVLGCIDHGIFA